MKKYLFIVAVVGIFILNFCADIFAMELAWENISRENLKIRSVLIDPDNNKIIYAGSSNAVIKSEDGGLTWRNILSIGGQNRSVNLFLFDPRDKNSLYAATGNGLYLSRNRGKNWNRVFKGKNFLEIECTELAVLPYGIYLGTKSGLFVSSDDGRSWRRENKIGNNQVLAISYCPKEQSGIYVASTGGIFKSADSGKSWERIFVAFSAGANDSEEAVTENQGEEGIFDIKYVSCDPRNFKNVYIATSKGVYKSQDKGMSWSLIPDFGMLSRDVSFLLVSKESEIYAVTESGVFKYNNERWFELSLGLSGVEVNSLALDVDGNLYAACDKGLFRGQLASGKDNTNNMISIYFEGEPRIEDLRQQAIKYAEVSPEKISEWRKKAAKKAILPQVSVGIDRNTTDLWHWEGGSTTKSDDDVLRRGKDAVNWDVALTWDLSDIIWNDAQTSIDVRSKLMVELREDILDQVNKLYFERLRVKAEMDNLAIEDRHKRFEKQLKLEELRASLDSLTAGYYSAQLRKLSSRQSS